MIMQMTLTSRLRFFFLVSPCPSPSLSTTRTASALAYSSSSSSCSPSSLPCFPVNAANVKVLQSPTDFYSRLQLGIQSAKSRILLTSLYIGHDQLALTESLRQALSSNPNLEIHILLDQLRSLRGVTKGTSSVDLLLPLIKEFGANSTSSTYSPSSSPPPPPRFSLSLYHSPLLSGIYKHITPPRFNEAFGLQHMKTYIFDKDLILSGANLNKDYFVNRQDRYIAFNGEKLLTDYYTDLCQTVARFSHNVVSSSSTSFHMEPPAQDSPPAPQMMSDFMKRWESSKAPCTDHHHNHHRPYWSIPMSKISQAVTDPSSSCLLGSSNSNNNTSSSNTLVIPLIQMGLYGIRQEEAIISNLLETVSNANASNVKKNVSIGRQSSLWNIYLASAYLNFPDSYITSLFSWNQSLSSSPSFSSSSSTTPTSSSISSLSSSISNSSTSSSVDIITASPRANGFYSSKGVSRHLPSAYTYLEILFMRAVEKLKRISTTTNQLNVHEYERGDGWTFHAKGVWISSSIPTTTTTTTATSSPLFITLIGSSNLGKRSMYRDLESTGLIVTRDEGLNRRLEEERDELMSFSRKITLNELYGVDRVPHPLVKLITRLIRSML